MRAEFDPRLRVSTTFCRLLFESVDYERRQARSKHRATAIRWANILVSNRLIDRFFDVSGNLSHTQGLWTGDVKSTTFLTNSGQSGESDAGDILDVDRREFGVVKR